MGVKSFLDKHSDGAVLFYDSEFGTPQSYFESYGIDMSRVLHCPLTDVEVLRTDIMNQLTRIENTDKVMILIDSIGNVASKKEVEDALEGSNKADMTRAKQIKSFFRMVTPYVSILNIPVIVVNHVYSTLDLFSKQIAEKLSIL